MPAPAGLAQRVRRPARPHGRQLPLRAHGHPWCPHQRRYVPGTMVLETTWHTPTGWLLVQDLLVVRARDGRRRGDPTTAGRPGDAAATGHPAAAGHLHRGPRRGGGQRGARLRVRDCRPGMWDYDGDGYETMTVCPPAGDPVAHRDVDPPPRRRRGPLLRPLDPREGRVGLRRALVGRPSARRPRRGAGPARRHRVLLAGLAVQRHLPRPPLAQLHGAQRPDAQGPELRAHRRHHGGGDDLAARDARRGAQLGLPLHLDPRLLLHAALALPARVRLGGARVLRLRARGAGRARPATSTCRSCTASTAGRT